MATMRLTRLIARGRQDTLGRSPILTPLEKEEFMKPTLVLSLVALLAFASLPVVCGAPAAAAVQPGTKTPKPLHVAKGSPVNLADYLIPGKTVVFDFYSDYCGPCVQVAPALEELHKKRADVVVVKVDINRPGIKGIDWKSPVAQQYKLNSIPHFKVYGPDGKLKAEDGPTSDRARKMVMAMLK
jgi:thiol-disulfide isomerase/thioredoxin